MGRNRNNSGEVSKNGPCRGDPNRSCVFSTLSLVAFVCSISTYWEKRGMLPLKTNLAVYCQNAQIGLQSLFFNTLFKDLLFEAYSPNSVVVWGVFTKLSCCLKRVHQTQVWGALQKVWEPLLQPFQRKRLLSSFLSMGVYITKLIDWERFNLVSF